MGNLIRQRQRRGVFANLDGGDGLARGTDGQSKLLLREILRFSQFSDSCLDDAHLRFAKSTLQNKEYQVPIELSITESYLSFSSRDITEKRIRSTFPVRSDALVCATQEERLSEKEVVTLEEFDRVGTMDFGNSAAA